MTTLPLEAKEDPDDHSKFLPLLYTLSYYFIYILNGFSKKNKETCFNQNPAQYLTHYYQ